MGAYLVGLDIGTKKTAVLVAEVDSDGLIEIIGAGHAASAGVEAGVVVDPRKTVNSIRKAVVKAEGISGTTINSVYAGISGDHIETFEGYGTVSITGPDRKISERDVRRVIRAAQPGQIPASKKVIQTGLKQYVVDSQGSITNPIGMIGSRLEVYQHVVTGSTTAVLNLVRAIENAGLKCKQIFLNSLASARAVLNRTARNQGVALLDIGGGITDLIVFKGGRPLLSTCLPISGGNITRDIAIVLTLPFEEAERIKISAGTPSKEGIENQERIEVTTVGGERKKLSQSRISEIIAPRWEELFELALNTIKENNLLANLSLGIIITGGASRIEGLVDFLQEKCEIPIRRGEVTSKVKGLQDIAGSPTYATAIGLVIYGSETEEYESMKRMDTSTFWPFRRAFKWLNQKLGD